MGIDRLGTYAKMLGDLVVGLAAGNRLKHLDFARRHFASGHFGLQDPRDFRRQHLAPAANLGDAFADIARLGGFQENAADARIDELGENGRGRVPCDDGKAGIGRPAPGLEKGFKPVGAWHGKIKQGAIGLQPLDEGNGLDAVCGAAGDFEAMGVLKHGRHALDNEGMVIGNHDAGALSRGISSDVRLPRNLRSPARWPGAVLVVSIILLALCTASYAQIRSEQPASDRAGGRLDLRGAVASETVSRFLTAYRDPSHDLSAEDVLQQDIAAQFRPVTTATPDFGYTKDAIWLKFEVMNQTAKERVWRLFFRENFMQQFAVFKVVAGEAPQPLILQNELSPFSTRPIGYPELVVPLELEPGDEAAILVRYESGGSSELSFSVETVESFEAKTSRRTAKNFIYYGMVVLLCIIATLAFIVTRQWVFMAYTLYAASMLLFIAHADGNAFKYLWPNEPLFNAFATIPVGTALAVFCANFARVFLKTRQYHPLMDKLLLGAIAVALFHLAASLFVDHQIIKKTLILVALASILLATVSGFVAAYSRFKQVRFYLIGWSGAFISASILSSRHWLGVEISEEVQFDSMRIVLVVDATLMGLAIWDSLNQGRKAQHLALKSSLINAERNLKLSTRLHELEQQYETVLKLAQQQEHRIADTLHDLRQPLHALRLNVNNLALAGDSKGDRQQIENTFGYLERLVSGHLAASASQLSANKTAATSTAGQETGRGELKLGAVLSGIHEMFLPDAREKGLDFRFVNSSLQSDADPLEVMRIVSNLVANAIKYTPQGKVLLGARRHGGKVRIEVHDTGPGMSAAQFEQAKLRSQRLAKTSVNGSGEGYGLSIVSELAARRGYEFARIADRDRGFSVGVTFPAQG